MIDKLRISLHQINTVTGDVFNNTKKILDLVKKDTQKNIHLSIFPETSISGYMCGALWDRKDFLIAQQQKLAEIQYLLQDEDHDGMVIIGYVHYENTQLDGFPLIYNAVAGITKTTIQVYKKILLAKGDHHEDKKYFTPGTPGTIDNNDLVFEHNFIDIGNIKFGVPICEDIWYTNHKENIPKLMKDLGAKFLISINQSYFHYNKHEERQKLLKKLSINLKIPIIYLNSCGVGDIVKNLVIFDGSSLVYDKNGNVLEMLPRFKEDNKVISFGNKGYFGTKKFHKYNEIIEALIFEQREFFRLNGIKKAQVHLSGGLDSSIAAAIIVKAMGKNNCIFITNPSSLNSNSLKYVEHICNKLDTNYYTNPIEDIYQLMLKVDNESFKDSNTTLSNTGKATMQAVLRTTQGLAASHRFKSGIVATGNHTEIVLGWASFHDIGSIGVHSILGDLTKIELFEIAAYINNILYKDNIIPEDLYNGKFAPAAELPDAMEDPIDYWIQSGICAMFIRDRKSREEIFIELQKEIPNMDYFPKTSEIKKYKIQELKDQVDWAYNKMKLSVYKAAQGAPIVIISPRSRGFSNRETLINKFI